MTVLRYLRAALGPSADGPTDADLLGRFVRDRDESAFELLVWRHAGLVLRTCRAVLRDHHAAEDAAQATFLTLARKAGSIGRREALAGWLYRVARRIAVRAARRPRPVPTDGCDHLPAPAAESDPDIAPLLHEELARLPDKYRLPVLLCFFQGLTHADAARQLGWPVGSVAGRIARAKDLLGRRLARRGVAVPAAGLVVAIGAEPVITPAFAAGTAAAAVAFAAGPGTVPGVTDEVLQLAHEGLRAMSGTKLTWAAGLVALCGALTLGGVHAGGQGPRPGTGPGGPPPAPAAGGNAPANPPAPPAESPPVIPLSELSTHQNGETVTIEFLVREVRRGKSQTRKADDAGPDDLILAGIMSLESDDRIQIVLTGAARPDWATWDKPPQNGGVKYLRQKVRATGRLSSAISLTFPAVAVTEVTVDDPKKVAVVDRPTANPNPPAAESGRAGAAQRMRSLDNLRKITLALHNYHAAQDHLPSDIRDKAGKPLLSWRVAILPYLGHDTLFKQFKLDEPWDSPHNLKLLAQMPDVFRVGIEPKGATHTYYQVFTGPGTAFDPKGVHHVAVGGGEAGAGGPGGAPPGAPAPPPAVARPGISLANVLDGTTNTLGVVEAGPPVPWTKPADIPYDPAKPLPKVAWPFRNALHVAFLDGSSRALRPDLGAVTLRGLIEIADGQVIPPDALKTAPLPPTTPEEKQQLADRIARNGEILARIDALHGEQVKLLEEANRGAKDIVEAEELAERLQAFADELAKLNQQIRDQTLKPGPKDPTPTRKE